ARHRGPHRPARWNAARSAAARALPFGAAPLARRKGGGEADSPREALLLRRGGGDQRHRAVRPPPAQEARAVRNPSAHRPRPGISAGEPMSGRRYQLRSLLLRWLLIPLGALCIVGALLARLTIQKAIDAAYDKSLSAAALDISEHLRMAREKPEVDLPPAALEMLDTEDQDRVFYSVGYRTPEQRYVFMTGYDDLPSAPDAPAGKTIFFDAQYRGEAIRVAALYTAMPSDPPVMALTEV